MCQESNTPTSDRVSAPGETIKDLLDAKGISLENLAGILGKTKTWVIYLLAGLEPISPETAQLLSKSLGSSPEFWLQREADFVQSLRSKLIPPPLLFDEVESDIVPAGTYVWGHHTGSGSPISWCDGMVTGVDLIKNINTITLGSNHSFVWARLPDAA